MFLDLLGGAFVAFGVLLIANFMGSAVRFRSLGLRVTRWSYGKSSLGEFFERITPSPWLFRLAGIGYVGMGIALIVACRGPSR